MPILDLESGNVISGVLSRGERGRTFKLALSRMQPNDVLAVRNALDHRIAGSRIETSAWIPGADWRGTPWQPIYDDGAAQSSDLAAMMFGLFVWEAFERHPLDWYTQRFSMGGDDDRFRVYFRPGD